MTMMLDMKGMHSIESMILHGESVLLYLFASYNVRPRVLTSVPNIQTSEHSLHSSKLAASFQIVRRASYSDQEHVKEAKQVRSHWRSEPAEKSMSKLLARLSKNGMVA